MPWCETCSKFWTPSSMNTDGSCPTCGRVLPVAEPPVTPPTSTTPPEPADPKEPKKLDLKELAGEDAKAPWHFKVLMVLLIVYLGWRFIQLAGVAF
jgi:hypothetical protein